MKQYVILMRGLPGSGKSTMARKVAEQKDAEIFSTDDYWICKDGEYRFDADRLTQAHEWNQERCRKALAQGKSIVVDNCNIKNEHMSPYIEMAEKHGATVAKVVSPRNHLATDELEWYSKHHVPQHIIEQMRKDWEE